MDFVKLSLADIDVFRPYLEHKRGRTCDYTVGGIFMWRDFFHMEYCIRDGALFSRLRGDDGRYYYNLPLARDDVQALDLLLRSAEPSERTLRFCTVPEEGLSLLAERCRIVRTEEQPVYFDYLYRADDLAALSGKRYGGQRNLIHQFLRSVRSWEYRPLTQDAPEEVRAFFVREYVSGGGSSGSEAAENEMVLEVLDNLARYRMSGGVLWADGRVVGFSLGEIAGDTLFTHIEKADRNCRGAYQMLVNQSAKSAAGRVRYINREEDMGDPGLRTAKMAYHPVCLLRKYIVEVEREPAP